MGKSRGSGGCSRDGRNCVLWGNRGSEGTAGWAGNCVLGKSRGSGRCSRDRRNSILGMEGGRENRGDFDAVELGAFAFARFASLLPLLPAKLPLFLLFGQRGGCDPRGEGAPRVLGVLGVLGWESAALGKHVDVQRGVNSRRFGGMNCWGRRRWRFRNCQRF